MYLANVLERSWRREEWIDSREGALNSSTPSVVDRLHATVFSLRPTLSNSNMTVSSCLLCLVHRLLVYSASSYCQSLSVADGVMQCRGICFFCLKSNIPYMGFGQKSNSVSNSVAFWPFIMWFYETRLFRPQLLVHSASVNNNTIGYSVDSAVNHSRATARVYVMIDEFRT